MSDAAHNYQQLTPSEHLQDLVDSYWLAENNGDTPRKMMIIPDSFFKLIVYLHKGQLSSISMVGLWGKETEVMFPANTVVYGTRFKVLAPEFLFNMEIPHLFESGTKLENTFWDLDKLDFSDLSVFVAQLEEKLSGKLGSKKIEDKKVNLSRILDKEMGNISAEEVASKVGWSNRQINRYLTKYLGLSLKSYLNIQKCYVAYPQIREGNLYPDEGFYDQPHFIREIRKHTGHAPGELLKGAADKDDDRFIQLRDIQEK